MGTMSGKRKIRITPQRENSKSAIATTTPSSLDASVVRDGNGNGNDNGSAVKFSSTEGCRKCGKDDDHAHLLLCEICNDEYHTYCLDPPLDYVPEGDFFCGELVVLYNMIAPDVVLKFACGWAWSIFARELVRKEGIM